MTWMDTLDTNLQASPVVDSFTYIDETGRSSTVYGVFTDEYVDDLNSQLRQPTVYVKLEDLGSGEIIGTLWIVSSTQYVAKAVERDGDGWAFVRLELQ